MMSKNVPFPQPLGIRSHLICIKLGGCIFSNFSSKETKSQEVTA